jgi:hypothetical protein
MVITDRDLERRAKLQKFIDQQDAARGRPLTATEKLENLRSALSEHDSDCLWHKGLECDCGAIRFAAR